MANIFNSISLFVSNLLFTQSEFDNNFNNMKNEYEQMKNEVNSKLNSSGGSGMGFPVWIPIVIFSVIFISITTFIIIAAIKSRKHTSDLANTVKNKMMEKMEKEENKNVCPYCGTRLREEDNRCPGCGAQRK